MGKNAQSGSWDNICKGEVRELSPGRYTSWVARNERSWKRIEIDGGCTNFGELANARMEMSMIMK